ncbi:MAG TPA: hypothetical protein VN638_03820, partial [Nitrospiraceae bacterium]|nr:hypothetical protein [Nitrospiraceae bacterium]
KLNLSATLLNEVEKKQVRDVLQILVTRVRAQVQYFGHRRGSRSIVGIPSLIADTPDIPQ